MAKLSKSEIKDLASFLDGVVKFHGILETLDGPAFRVILGAINNNFGDKIPDSLNPLIGELLKNVEAGNYAAAEKQFADFLAGIIKTPFIDGTPEEKIVYEAVFEELGKLIFKQGAVTAGVDKVKATAADSGDGTPGGPGVGGA